MALVNYFEDKKVLVTGGCGTVGTELVRHLLKLNPVELRIFDNNEDAVFDMERRYGQHGCLSVSIGDIRDAYRTREVTDGIDIIFHVAALKHVQICERSPSDAVMTNIIGTENIIRAALHNQVKTCIFTSTDKAVSPTNVMGTSKLMAERLVTAANNYSKNGTPVFASTRFGNVLASRGSVLRIFYDQIRRGGPVTITDEAMTRFIMTVDESVRLICAAALLAKGGEVFVPKMRTVRIRELADAMIELVCGRIGKDQRSIGSTVIGARLGERLFEELMTEEESARALELEDMFAILPAKGAFRMERQYAYSGNVKPCKVQGYNSEDGALLSKDEIKQYFGQVGILDYLETNDGTGELQN